VERDVPGNPTIKEVLTSVDFGNSVAEFDEALESHFVETESFRSLVSGKYDVIAGDKGTGKTALYRVLVRRLSAVPALSHVDVIPAFNPSGNPIFQRLTHTPPLPEGQYITVWKSFFLALVGNWLLERAGAHSSGKLAELDALLRSIELRSSEDSASTVFSRVVNRLQRWFKPKSAEVAFTLSESGIPIVTPRVEFDDRAAGEMNVIPQVIPHERAFALLNECLESLGVTVWAVMDRLDEAFQGYPDTERPALRALLRTYLDLLEFGSIRIKLFVRRDLFKKIVQGGFVNLTHINARRMDIVWEEEDLRNLLCRRIRGSRKLDEIASTANKSDREIFDLVFPGQVASGSRRPTTWNWILSRIRDGNNVRPPRNLIDLANKAREIQLRAEDRSPRRFGYGEALLEADSVRRALQRLSEDRVQDTLLAEMPDLAPMIERFRDGKAEHNTHSLSAVLRIPSTEVRSAIKPLVELGFMEEIGDIFKIPMLYRDGLSITQGKAYAGGGAETSDGEE
jgi:hypothetical protein